jgi:drug/metabolite transporter (DMT)-like permease
VPHGTQPTYHDNGRGIVALVTACALFSVNDVLMKMTTLTYPASEVLFVRGVITVLFAVVALVFTASPGWLLASLKQSVLLRAFLEASAHVCFIVAISRMRLVELLAVNLFSPVILTMFLGLFLKEHVGWRRWLAVLAGLAGALCIVKPSPSAYNAWALLALLGAVASALREVATRRIQSDVPTAAINLSSLVAITLAGVVLALLLGDRWVMLPPKYLLFVTTAAVVLSMGGYFAVSAFRNVDITVVAPFRYTLLIWGALAGYLLFDETPDPWSRFGMLLIVGSGLYILHREGMRLR